MNGPSAGLFAGRYRYLRIGTGPSPLVVLTGLTLVNRPPGRALARAYAHAFRPLAARHTVYLVQRPLGLPAGASTADLAADHAAALGPALGRFRLVGMSTGGLVAQELALGHPELVDRLALVVSGARIAEPGRAICERWSELVAARRWAALRGSLAAAAVDGAVPQRLARALAGLLGARPTEQEAADFATTVAAVLAHDTRRRLARLRPPLLVIGGVVDPFFPDDVLRHTTSAVPGACVHVLAGGHGVPKQRSREVFAALAGFLR